MSSARATKKKRGRESSPTTTQKVAPRRTSDDIIASTPEAAPPPPPPPSAEEEYPLIPLNISPATKVILCGSFPPPANRRDMPFFYPNVQNDMWRILGSLFYGDQGHFFREVPKPNGRGLRKAFDQDKVHGFAREHPEFGFCDVAKRIRRKTNDASDEGLVIIEQFDFLHDVLPKAPTCGAIITTGTLALTTLLNQRDASALPAAPLGAKGKRGPRAAIPAIGKSTPWTFPVVGPDGRVTNRTVHIHRAPSTSRAYPRPLSEKEAIYRTMVGAYCTL